MQVLANQSGYQPSTTYTILSAGSGVQGTFSQVNANYAFLAPTLSYDPDHDLRLVSNGTAFPDVATTPNQRSVAGALGAGAGNPLYDAVVTTDATTARRAYGMLDGELQASLKSMLLLDSRYVRDAVTDRVRPRARIRPLAALSSGARPCAATTRPARSTRRCRRNAGSARATAATAARLTSRSSGAGVRRPQPAHRRRQRVDGQPQHDGLHRRCRHGAQRQVASGHRGRHAQLARQ